MGQHQGHVPVMGVAEESSPSEGLILMDAARISRALNRMACEILEDVPSVSALAVLGVDVRGYNLALSLAKAIEGNSGSDNLVPCFRLAVRDRAGVTDQLADVLPQHTHLVIVDDVLFSGSVMMKAVKRVVEFIEPESLYAAVLVDRGHRRFPLSARYIGINSPTKLDEHVAVHFSASGEPGNVVLTRS